ncbi:MAG TPA: VWA domain-containing protein, partial [Thermomicrobiales bacterium]|nr:VWA domain-containing protein [Thermomicrobiales bacterium]
MSGDFALLAPLGLLGLLASVAIVILHMRRRTPPAVTLPSLRFWRPAEEDQADRNRLRRPPVTLPLILQVLAAAVIALGLARPVVGGLLGEFGQRTEPQHLIMVLDGSTSMNAAAPEAGSRTRWDLARQEAMEALRDWQEGDVTTLVIAAGRLDTFSASTRPQVDAALDRLAIMDVPGGQMDLNAALELTRSLLLPDRSNRIT